MPRSGSTLVEQILASHPSVFGAGERLDFGEEVARLSAAGGLVFPEIVAALSGEDLEALGARYLRRVSVAAPGAERITDKMPFNFLFAELIPGDRAALTPLTRAPIQTFNVTGGNGTNGTDWTDMALDAHNIYYDGEGTKIRQFDPATTNTQNSDFTSAATESALDHIFAFRVISTGADAGDVLVASTSSKRGAAVAAGRQVPQSEAAVLEVWLEDSDGERQVAVPQGRRVMVRALVSFAAGVEDPQASLYVLDEEKRSIVVGTTVLDHDRSGSFGAGDQVVFSFSFDNVLAPGRYSPVVDLFGAVGACSGSIATRTHSHSWSPVRTRSAGWSTCPWT